MALVPFTGTITAATLNANFDDKTASLSTQAKQGQKDQNINLRVLAITSGKAQTERSIQFTMTDDMEVRILALRCIDGTAGRVITLRLLEANGDTTFLSDLPFEVSATTVVGTVDSRADFRTTTGQRIKLLRGIKYRLGFISDNVGATTEVQGVLQLRSVRRVG